MSEPRDPTEQELEDEAIAEDDLIGDYPRRGRPRKPADQRRRAKLIISLTGDELSRLIVRATEVKDHKGRPLKVQDWARDVLLALAPTGGAKKEG